MARGKWRPENLCSTCACNPCQCTPEQNREKNRQRNVERVREKNKPQPASAATPSKSQLKKEQNKKKKEFIKDWRRRNPTGTDAELKAALKKAGLGGGCAVIAILLLASPVGGAIWGGYEIARAVWG